METSRASRINTLADAAVTAIEAGDNATALIKLRAAKALLSTIPNGSAEGAALQWNPTAIDALINDLKQANAIPSAVRTGGGVVQIPIKYVNQDD